MTFKKKTIFFLIAVPLLMLIFFITLAGIAKADSHTTSYDWKSPSDITATVSDPTQPSGKSSFEFTGNIGSSGQGSFSHTFDGKNASVTYSCQSITVTLNVKYDSSSKAYLVEDLTTYSVGGEPQPYSTGPCGLNFTQGQIANPNNINPGSKGSGGDSPGGYVPSPGAAAFCKDRPSDTIKKCEQWYDAAAGGGANPCTNLSGDDQNECLNDFNHGQPPPPPPQTCPSGQTGTPPNCAAADNSEQECGDSNTDLSWILCPIFFGVQAAADKMNDWVTSMLEVNPCPIFGPSNSSGDSSNDCSQTAGATSTAYHQAWSDFRDIALIIIVIAGLVMIVAQAIGSQAVDAYTIKSTMPRLLIAAILISLSWILMQFAIDLTNILGHGIRALIYGPFRGLGSGAVAGQGASGAAETGGIALLLGVGAITALFLHIFMGVGVGVIFGLIMAVALAMLIGLLVVMIRQILITFLIIVAPLAIACYALPNTKKAFSMWWDNFLKLLMMFPIIIAFIAVGRVFAMVSLTNASSASAPGEGALLTVMAILAYILPFFFLPITFRMAGGMMGSIGGSLHQWGKQKGAARKKRNAETMARNKAENRAKMKTGDYLSNRNRLTRGFNNVSRGLGSGGLMGAYGLTKRGKASVERVRGAATAERLKEPGVQQALQDENVRAALLHEGPGQAKEALEKIRSNETTRMLDEVSKGNMTQDQMDRNLTELKTNHDNALAMAKSIGFNSSSQAAALQADTTTGGGRAISNLAKVNSGGNDNTELDRIVKKVASSTGQNATRLHQESMQNLGGAGRMDMRGATIQEALTRFDAKNLPAQTDTSVRNLVNGMNGNMSHADVNVATNAAAQVLSSYDIRGTLSQPAQAALNQEMQKMGIDFNSQTPVEEQLATMINSLHPGSTLTGADLRNRVAPMSPTVQSDRRLKRSIKYLLSTQDGIKLYRFQYFWSDETYVGVIAQDLLDTHPEALSLDEFGYYRVDYSLLGLEMVTLDQWQASQARNSVKS